MSGPLQSLADPMSTYNTSMRFIQAERKKQDEVRRAQVNKEYEKALDEAIKFSSKQLECKGQCKHEELTPEELRYREASDREFNEWNRKRLKRQEEFHKKIEQSFSCTIL